MESKDPYHAEGTEMQVQTVSTGMPTNDEGDFKKRVDESLSKLANADKGSAAPTDTPAK